MIKKITRKENFVGHKLSSNIVHFNTDGKFLLTGGRDGYLNIWHLGNYKINSCS
ncbi:WD40 domain-containing protein [Flavobacteriales bacterium]|nr:WD40 domain-containing protein [Flavobacteriales bacterium]